jgi:glycerophosphoryl diester phosphodiesterase
VEAGIRSVKAAARQGLIICAHRSWLSPDQVENSLDQMRGTANAGPFMLEMDLTKNRDGTIVIIHDPTADRTTNGAGPVAQMDSAAIDTLHLRSADGHLTAEPPPRFEAVAAWAQATPSVLLMLDLKKTPPAEAFAIVRRHRLTSRIVALTFDKAVAQQAFAADPNVTVSVLVTSRQDLEDYQRMAGLTRRFAAYIPRDADPALARAARAVKALVVTDAIMESKSDPIESLADYRQLFESRPIDIFVTNHPQTALEATAADPPRPLR